MTIALVDVIVPACCIILVASGFVEICIHSDSWNELLELV